MLEFHDAELITAISCADTVRRVNFGQKTHMFSVTPTLCGGTVKLDSSAQFWFTSWVILLCKRSSKRACFLLGFGIWLLYCNSTVDTADGFPRASRWPCGGSLQASDDAFWSTCYYVYVVLRTVYTYSFQISDFRATSHERGAQAGAKSSLTHSVASVVIIRHSSNSYSSTVLASYGVVDYKVKRLDATTTS